MSLWNFLNILNTGRPVCHDEESDVCCRHRFALLLKCRYFRNGRDTRIKINERNKWIGMRLLGRIGKIEQ